MDGIQYIVTEQGDKTAVLIDLKKYKGIWEDFYDLLVAKSRENEPRTSLKDVKDKLIKQGKLDEKL
ncbi:MAG: hypothetical protein WCR42_09560 [bacterium]